jgi:hypothetical protein
MNLLTKNNVRQENAQQSGQSLSGDLPRNDSSFAALGCVTAPAAESSITLNSSAKRSSTLLRPTFLLLPLHDQSAGLSVEPAA